MYFVIFQMSVIGATRRRQVPLDRAALETDQGAALGAGRSHGRHHSPAGIYFWWNLNSLEDYHFLLLKKIM